MSPSSTHRSVLIGDDDQRLADALAVLLRQHGFHTAVAYSGAEAVQTALRMRPDFIVSDVCMDGIDGVDAAIAISEMLPNCRILLMSGAPDVMTKLDKGTRRGHAFELLTKPVLGPSLLDRLRD